MSSHIIISTQGSGLSQPVDERIIRKIDQLVNVGVKDTHEMRRHLDVFVKNEIMSEDEIQPLPSNRRFYPKLSDIRSHIYRATMKHRFSKVDQENEAEKVIHWKASSPEDFFYFRPYGEAPPGHTDVEGDNKEDIQTLLFIHQTAWQRRLLQRYGNDMCLLDATYKTTRYSLPLLFLVLRTNVDYQVVGSFIVQNETKSRLNSAPVWTYFAVDRKTILATDASHLKGLGFVLLQLVDDVWKPVQAGSRFLTPAESRYAMIELEALATCWAMKKCNMFVQGLPHFTLLTDHQPLIPILNSMGIADVENPRLQRLMMKMLPYSFTAEWVKGKDHLAADALSRFPVDQPSLDDELCDVHAEAAVKIQFADESVEDLQLQEVSEAQQNDPQLSQVTEYIRCGWPDSLQEVATIAKPFWPIRHNLYLITPTSGSSII